MEIPSLGTLATLPREVRDKIYRCLVKERYLIRLESRLLPHINSPRNTNLAILSASKATYDEATTVLFLESTFKYELDLYAKLNGKPMGPAWSRMMRIETYFLGGACRVSPGISSIPRLLDLGDILDNFTGRGTLRNTIFITFEIAYPGGPLSLGGRLFRRLKALVGFRVVTLEILPWGYGDELLDVDHLMEPYESITLAVAKEMTPTLGPAIVTHNDIRVCVTFYPLEHSRLKLRDHPKELPVDSTAGFEESN